MRRPVAGIMLSAFFLFLLLSPGAPATAGAPATTGALSVHFIDVGHGDAALVRTPGGKNILIDSGAGEAVWSMGDMGDLVVLPYLEKLGVDALDMLILSHAHYDHIGGIPSLLQRVRVREVVDSGYSHDSAAYRNLLLLIKEKGIAYRKAGTGDLLPFGEGVTARVLHPRDTKQRWGKRGGANNNSLLIRMTYGNVSFLFTGDLEEEGEREAMRTGYPLRSQILKVGHHGSTTSTRGPFVSAVRPEVAVVSCGPRPKFPHQKPARNLRAVGAKIFRTDLEGTIVVRTDGKTYSVETEGGYR